MAEQTEDPAVKGIFWRLPIVTNSRIVVIYRYKLWVPEVFV